MNKAILILGSNLGNKENNIKFALEKINKEIGKVAQQTKIIETYPEGYVSKNNFLNSGAIINTLLSPIKLLQALKKIEKDMGRSKDSSINNCYEDRIIDIDIIYFNTITFISKRLKIPHIEHTGKRDFSKNILKFLH